MTVRELLARIDSLELTEWMAAYNVEPWGEDRSDLRAGIVASTVANCHSTKGHEFKPSDFIPQFVEMEKPQQTPEQMQRMARKLNAMFGGSVE